MKRFYMSLAIVLTATAAAIAATPLSEAPARKMLRPGDIQRSAPRFKAPNDLGGNFSSWEVLGEGRFNAETGLCEAIDPLTVYYCTTDPNGWGVDSWYFEGLFDGVRMAGMPYIDYYQINQGDTGLTYKGKPVKYEELSRYYDIGMESYYEEALGLFHLAMLYYVDDPSDPDNVIAYGYETVQLAGEFKDYRVDLSIAGETAEGNALKVNNSFVDATDVKIQLYPEEMNYPILIRTAASQRANESIPTLTECAPQYFALEGDGTYTALMTYTGKDGEQGFLYDYYEYDSRWDDCGTADFTDDYLASYYSDFPILTATGLKLQKHKEKNVYRIVNPYTTDNTWTSVWSKLQPAEPDCNSFFVINAEKPEQTYICINPSDITYDDGVRMVVGSAAHYNIINDRTEEQITEKGYWGTTAQDENGDLIVTFPRMTLMMRPFNSEYPLFAGFNDAFKAVLHLSSTLTTMEKADSEKPEYYTIEGVRVENPVRGGLYLKRSGDKTIKVIVR